MEKNQYFKNMTLSFYELKCYALKNVRAFVYTMSQRGRISIDHENIFM
jgi:hypothetical protein